MPAKKEDRAFNLLVLLQQSMDAYYNARNKELAPYGISSREAATLHAIVSIGKDVTPAKLARWVYRKPHTISGILNRMRKKGLVTLTKDFEIKNLVRIALTPKGQEVYKESNKRKTVHRTFKDVIGEDYDQLAASLTKIRDSALKQAGDTIHRPFP